MSYDIVVRFPTKKLADEFCGQMSDGFGENFCDFSVREEIPNSDPTKKSSYRKVVDDQGRRVYFVSWIDVP